MAKITYNIVFGPANFELVTGTELALLAPADSGASQFNAEFTTPRGDKIKGTASSTSLEFTKQEIADHDLPTDNGGRPLFKGLSVKYIGPNTPLISNGDFVIVQDLWYEGNRLECRCQHTSNSRINTDGRVVVKCTSLDRGI